MSFKGLRRIEKAELQWQEKKKNERITWTLSLFFLVSLPPPPVHVTGKRFNRKVGSWAKKIRYASEHIS